MKAASVPEVAAEQDKGAASKPEIGPILLGIVSKHWVLIYSAINPYLLAEIKPLQLGMTTSY